MITRPPFRAPHHSASQASMLGGGSGRVRPGEVSRAHLGTLFLDEFPLFNADIVQALRQPLESGDVTIARGEESATFPARAMVVVACNPCPCGYYHPTNRDNRCSCTETRRRHYRTKLEGPVIDRIDIVRHVEPVAPARGLRPARPTRVDRDGAGPGDHGARAPGRALRRHRLAAQRGRARTDAAPAPPAARRRGTAARQSDGGRGRHRRGATRVHRVAWTVADLRGLDQPGADEVDVALRLRTGAPLLLARWPRRAAA